MKRTPLAPATLKRSPAGQAYRALLAYRLRAGRRHTDARSIGDLGFMGASPKPCLGLWEERAGRDAPPKLVTRYPIV